MRRATAPMARLAALAATLAACSPAVVPLPGGSDASTETGSPGSGTDAASDASATIAACGSYAYTRCSFLEMCSSVAVAYRYGTVDVCKKIFTELCVNSLGAPSTGASIATINGCAQELNTSDWGCNNFLYTVNIPMGCQQPTGALANGATCAVNQQCQSGFCQLPLHGACGTCGTLPDAGASCAEFLCPQGLTCVEGACVAFALQGQGCSGAQPCGEGLTCVVPSGAANGTCQVGATGMNTACSFTGAGCSFYSGYTCNAQTNECATLGFGVPGAACGTVGDQFASCSGGTCLRGACVANALIGQPCDIVSGPACTADERCILSDADGGTAGTCQVNGFAACE